MFIHMNPLTRRAWLRWAWSHDWGRSAAFDQSGRLNVLTDGGVLLFSHPAPLKAWAKSQP